MSSGLAVRRWLAWSSLAPQQAGRVRPLLFVTSVLHWAGCSPATRIAGRSPA